MNQIKCKYIFNDNYNPKYINGAQGGINPQGEIVINFYLERGALPVSQTYSIKDGSLSSEELGSEPSDLKSSLVRVVENGVIMNYSTAKAVHKWLGEHIASLEAIDKQ